MPKDAGKNKKTRSKNKKSESVDLMKDLPPDQLEDLEHTLSDSDR